MTKLEQELERVSIQNLKLRNELNAYIEHKNELIHITLSPDRWKEFIEFLETKRRKK